MSLQSFTPNTVIESSKVNSNFTNLSNHCRSFTMLWPFAGGLAVQTSNLWLELPDDATLERCDLVVATVPTGAAIIVDIERSVDGGANWVTIFTGGTNRPQIAISARTGNTTTIDVPGSTGNSTLYRAKIAQVGSTIPGYDLAVMLKGKYNLT